MPNSFQDIVYIDEIIFEMVISERNSSIVEFLQNEFLKSTNLV